MVTRMHIEAASAPRTEPDLVDRVLEYLAKELQVPAERLRRAENALRAELGGDRHYIRRTSKADRDLAVRILALFNGRNATEVARQLGIGKTTVYRLIKQAGKKA